MAPKKSKKISLNEFLGDSTLGSWADEMESLPNAPAPRIEEEHSGDRYGRRDDFLTSRPDRSAAPIREDVPLPSQPPYTAFVGNLSFDLTESELEEFFSGLKIKSVKIIRDKDEKPKGFGYVEFEDLEGLKEALIKSGSNFSGRTIRVSVAEPPKERAGFNVGAEDSSKFDNPWRRDGPLPDLPTTRDSSRRRVDGPPNERQSSSASDAVNDWRSSRPPRVVEADPPSFKRKGSGLFATESQSGLADKEDVWVIGSKFKPSGNTPNDDGVPKSYRVKGDATLSKDTVNDEGDWRSSARPPKTFATRTSPNSSTPTTPQLARKKLELLPRSGNASVSPSPLSSPKLGNTPTTSGSTKVNPFGGARPVDVTPRDKEVAERLERERESQENMSRSTSRTGVDRGTHPRPRTPSTTSLPKGPSVKPSAPSLAPTVRPSLSFANVAAKKDTLPRTKDETVSEVGAVEQVVEDVAKVTV